MALQASFDILSRVVEQYETGDRTVRHVEVTTDEESDGLRVSMEIPVSLCAASDDRVRSALTPKTATLTNGGIQVEFSTSPLASLPQSAAAAVSASEEAVRVVDDSVMLSVELSIDPAAAPQELERTQKRSEPTATTASAPAVAGVADGSSDGAVVTAPQQLDRDTDDAARADESGGHEDATADSDSGTDRDADLAAVRDESVPPYDDRAYLARLYEVCDTFTEMSDVIDMDVSSETVRRYMIEADVHCPASYDVVDANEEPEETDTRGTVDESDQGEESTRGDQREDASEVRQNEDVDQVRQNEDAGETDQSAPADRPKRVNVSEQEANSDESETAPHRPSEETEMRPPTEAEEPITDVPEEQLVTDGSGLPSGVELRDVADAVVDSVTVYQVQRRLGLERQQTLDLLKRLNLIDFATGRVSDQPTQSVSYEQVVARIRETAPGEA